MRATCTKQCKDEKTADDRCVSKLTKASHPPVLVLLSVPLHIIPALAVKAVGWCPNLATGRTDRTGRSECDTCWQPGTDLSCLKETFTSRRWRRAPKTKPKTQPTDSEAHCKQQQHNLPINRRAHLYQIPCKLTQPPSHLPATKPKTLNCAHAVFVCPVFLCDCCVFLPVSHNSLIRTLG